MVVVSVSSKGSFLVYLGHIGHIGHTDQARGLTDPQKSLQHYAAGELGPPRSWWGCRTCFIIHIVHIHVFALRIQDMSIFDF